MTASRRRSDKHRVAIMAIRQHMTAWDAQTEEIIGAKLRGSSDMTLRTDVGCACRSGMVILRGRVPSYFLKQVAQTLAAGVVGVPAVVNQIQVVPT